VQLLKIFVSER